MPFDTATIARAMRAAGLDPNRPDHVTRFRDALLAELAELPQRALERFRESGDASEVLASTADRVVFEDQDQRVQQFNLHNDPNELFKLTDLSRERVTPEQVRGRQVSRPKPTIAPGDNFTPAEGYPDGYQGNPPGTRHTMTPTGEKPTRHTMGPPNKPSKPDLDALWRQAKDEGKV